MENLFVSPSFRVVRRGYDRSEVDHYVDWVETEVAIASRLFDRYLSGADRPQMEDGAGRALGRTGLDAEGDRIAMGSQAAERSLESDAASLLARAEVAMQTMLETATAEWSAVATQAAAAPSRTCIAAQRRVARARVVSRREIGRADEAAKRRVELEGEIRELTEQRDHLLEQSNHTPR